MESTVGTFAHQGDKVPPNEVINPVDGGAAARLEEMGYKQELTRSLGMVSVLGLVPTAHGGTRKADAL